MINRHKLVYMCLMFAIWPYMTFGFISEEIAHFIEPMRSFVYLICDLLMVFAGLITLSKRSDKIIIISFIVLAILTNTINHESYLMMVNGMRDFIGLLFAMPALRFLLESKQGEEFRKKFDRQLYVYLIIQAVCLTEQFMRYGANDHGGGSWGNNSSAIVSTSIYFISFCLMTRRWDDELSYWRNLGRNFILIFLLYPTFLNETKVSFIYLLFYFLFLMKINRTYIVRLVASIPIIIIIAPLLGWAYLTITNQNEEKVFSQEAMSLYLFGGDQEDELIEMMLKVQDNPDIEVDNMWVVDLPRFTKIFLLRDLLRTTRGGALLGAGVGHFKGGTQMAVSRLSIDNSWAFRGTRPMLFVLLLQMGWIGVIWFVLSMISDIGFKINTTRMSMNIKLMFTGIVLIMLFYNDSLRAMPLCVLLFYGLANTVCKEPPDSKPHDQITSVKA